MRFYWPVCLMVALSCSSNDAENIAVVPDYFPLKTGSWFIYSVDSVITDQNIPTAWAYDLRIQVIDSFRSTSTDYTWILQRSKRPDATKPWTSMTTWSARINNDQLVVAEGNVSYVRIQGPLSNGTLWNGNSLNDLGGIEKCPGAISYDCDVYTIANAGAAYAVPEFSAGSSITVIENEDDDVVSRDLRSDIYGKKIGLMYREIIQADYCGSNCSDPSFVDHGVNYKQTLTAYGGF